MVDSPPRIVVPITLEEQIRMRNLLPWGNIGKVMHTLLLQVLDLVEHHGGEIVIGAILSGNLELINIIKRREVERGPK